MRFKQYLRELEELDKPFTIKMPDEAAFEWIKTNSHKYAKGLSIHSALFRGMKTKDPGTPQWGDSAHFKRTSANTFNYYTLMMDSNEKWEHFPKRSKAFICSSLERSASTYGEIHVVFPSDETELGECPSNDIWNSFRQKLNRLELRSLNHFNGFLDYLAGALGEHLSEASAEELRSDLRKITWKKIESVRHDDKHFPFGNNYSGAAIQIASVMNSNHLDTLEDLVDWVLDPDDANFDLIKTSHFHDLNGGHGHEYWFNGKAVFIPISLLVNSESEFGKLFTAEFGKFGS